MADEIKLKAPTVEQQVVVNINGEDKLRSFSDTLEKIANNKNLQKYWKTQQELINATADAYGNFSKKASKDNATELIKVTNALKAMSGTDLSNILPDFDKIAKSMSDAQKVVGNLDSAFSVNSFKDAFSSFETLKAYGVDIQNFFNHFGVSFDVGELQNNVRVLENEVERLFRQLLRAKETNEELRNEFENFKIGSGLSDKLDELDNLKSELENLRNQAKETFEQFLKLNNISIDGYDEYGEYDDNRFRKYFVNIQNGYMSASDAISQFKREYSYLLEEGFKSSNDTFGLEQLQLFSNKLDSVFHQVEETSNKINDIISNGVITKSIENLSADNNLSNQQRSLFNNLLQDEKSLKSITTLIQKLIEESNQTKNTELFNEEQFNRLLILFDKIESSLSFMKTVLVDVGDGEMFSPLLKMIDNVQSSVKELSTSVSGIKLDVNMDLGSEVNERLNQKVSQSLNRQLEAYRNFYSAMKSTKKTNKEMLRFHEPDDASISEIIGAYKGVIKRAEDQYGKDIYKKLIGKDAYNSYVKEIKNATDQFNRATNKKNTENPLGDLFGKTDLTEVVSQLEQIVLKLDEISQTAGGFKDLFSNGLNVSTSIEEVEKLTNKVKELEDELAKIKITPIENGNKSNISSGNVNNTNIESQKQNVESIVKFVDNYGRELDEVNSKLLEGTALLDKQGKLIRLYHGSDVEFDKFDLSKSTNSNNQIYGKGAYLIENEKGAQGYGNVVTQWYANVRAVLNEEQQLTLEEAKKLYSEFGNQFMSIFTGKPMDFNEFFDNYLDFNPDETTIVEKMKSFAAFLGKDIGEVLSTIGYDAIKMDRSNGTFYTIFDPDRIIRFKDEVQKAVSVVNDLNKAQTNSTIEDVFQNDSDSSSTSIKEETSALTENANAVNQAVQAKQESIIADENSKNAANETQLSLRDEAELMEQIATSASTAAQAKQDFVTANENVQSSVDGSKPPLQLEAELMQQIAKDARDAADAKKEFVETNKQVKDSADDSNNSMVNGHSDNAEPSGTKKYKKKGYKAHDIGNHDNEETVTKKSELSATLKKLQTEIIASIDETTSFIKEITDFYDSADNLVKTQMKVVDKDGSQRTYTTSYSKDGDDFKAWTSHIDTQKFKNVEEQENIEANQKAYQKLIDTIQQYSEVQKRIYSGNALENDIELAQRLEAEIFELQKQPILSSSQIDKSDRMLEKILNQIDSIEKKQQAKVAKQESDNEAKENSKIWNDNLNKIKEYLDAKTKLNNLEASNVGKNDTENITRQRQEVERLKIEAGEARATLSKLFSPYKQGETPGDDWKEMMSIFRQATDGSEESVAKLNDSINKFNTSELQSLDKYIESVQKKLNETNASRPDSQKSSDFQNYIKQVQQHIDDLIAERNRLEQAVESGNINLIDNNDLKQVKDLQEEITKAELSFKTLFKGSSENSRRKEIDTISKQLKKNSKYSEEAKEKLRGYIETLENGNADADVNKIHIEFLKVIEDERMAGREGQSFIDILKDKAVGNFAAQLVGYYLSWTDLIQYAKQGIETVHKLDTALTEMRKVSDESVQSLKNYQMSTFDIADAVGTTAVQIQNSTAEWQKLGYSIQEASVLAKNSNIYKNVGDMEIEEATEHMVSSVQAWKSEFNDNVIETSQAIIDRYNKVGKRHCLNIW